MDAGNEKAATGMIAQFLESKPEEAQQTETVDVRSVGEGKCGKEYREPDETYERLRTLYVV